MQNTLICCDWGTTSLRIRLVDIESAETIDQELSDLGSAVLFGKWRQTFGDSRKDRVGFYLHHLHGILEKLAERNRFEIRKTPIVISGMASSSVGLMELQYAELPFLTDGSNAHVAPISYHELFDHPVLLISGVKDKDEVMRGEETQLVGLADMFGDMGEFERLLVILPGTHSKHIYLHQGQLMEFNTFVTGELFDNLTKSGLLKESVIAGRAAIADWSSFKLGLDDSAGSNLLNKLFKVRTNRLFNRFTAEENYQYLSGLLIGYELRAMRGKMDKIVVGSSTNLFQPYAIAMGYLGFSNGVCIDPNDVALATTKGQLNIAKRYL